MYKLYLRLDKEDIVFEADEAFCKANPELGVDQKIFLSHDDDGSHDFAIWTWSKTWCGDFDDDGNPVVETGEYDDEGEEITRPAEWNDDGWEYEEDVKLDSEQLNKLSGGRWNEVRQGASFIPSLGGAYSTMIVSDSPISNNGPRSAGAEEIR